MTVKYERVINSLYGKVESGFEDVFSKKVDQVEKAVKKTHSNFFRKLIVKTIDKKSAPSLGAYTPVWTPLSKNYLEKKTKEGRPLGFFMYSGALKSALASLNPKTVLGTPIVLFTPAGLVGRSGVTARQEVWKGQASKRRVIRDSSGRFAKSGDVLRRVKASISVDPYPKIVEDIRNQIVEESNYLSDDISSKLKNPSGQRKRPLFTNFLNWYLDTEIQQSVKKAIRL